MIFLKLREVQGNLSSSEEAIFRNLIPANDSPFSASFLSLPRGPYFTRNLDNLQPRLANEKGAILETHVLPTIFLKFWKNNGKSVIVWGGGAIFRTLIAAKDSPFPAPFAYFARCPDFYPEFGPSLAVIR